MSEAKNVLDNIGRQVLSGAGVRLAFGDAVHAQGKTIIPVARAGFGFGGGAGDHSGQKGEGGGGGGGAMAVGVVEITEGSTRFIRFSPWRGLAVAAALGLLAGLIIGTSVRGRIGQSGQ